MLRINPAYLILSLLCWHSVFASTGEDMKILIEKGEVNAAYMLGMENNSDEAGDPQFDYYFSLAAIETGHLEQAVFALERVLIQQPQHHRARLELARAQFMLGDNLTAKALFETVLASNPPDNVKARIKLFLDKIDAHLSASRRQVSGYAEATVGYDSNINSATSNTLITTPALGQVTLDETSKETDDEFSKLSAGADIKYALSKRTGLFASTNIIAQDNSRSDSYDTSIASIRTGVSHARGTDRFELPIQFQQLWVDSETFRRMLTLGGEWGHTLSSANKLSLFAQYGTLRFPDQKTRDADLVLAGGSWTHNVTNKWMVASSAYYGREDADESAGKHNGRDYYGLRIGNQWILTPKHALFAILAGQRVEHAADHPVFAKTRTDDFYQASLGWAWQFSRNLVLKTDLEYYDNQSNIPLFEYSRSVVQATLRYAF